MTTPPPNPPNSPTGDLRKIDPRIVDKGDLTVEGGLFTSILER